MMKKHMTNAQHHEWETIKKMVAEGAEEWHGYHLCRDGGIQASAYRHVNILTLRALRDAGLIEFMSGVKRFKVTAKGLVEINNQYEYGAKLTDAGRAEIAPEPMIVNPYKVGDEVVYGEASCKVIAVDGEMCVLSDADYYPEGRKYYAGEVKAHFSEVEYDYGICEYEHPLDKDGVCQICRENAEYDRASIDALSSDPPVESGSAASNPNPATLNILDLLWDSTDELHRRFGVYPPNPEATLRVFREEAEEFDEAACEMIADSNFNAGCSDTCAEAADTIVTILATLSGLGITREDFALWAQRVAEKNNAKTWDTHTINPATGKITRKAKVVSDASEEDTLLNSMMNGEG